MITERDALIIALEDQRNRALTESVEKSVLLARQSNEIEELKAKMEEMRIELEKVTADVIEEGTDDGTA